MSNTNAIEQNSHYYNQRLQKAEATRREQIDELRKGFDDGIQAKEVAADHRVERLEKAYTDEKKDVEKSFSVNIDRAAKDMKKNVASIKDRNSEEKVEITKQFEKERRDMHEKFQQEIESITKSFKNVVAGKDRDIEELKSRYEDRLMKQQDLSKERMDSMRDNFEERIVDINEKHQADLKSLVKRFKV